MIILVLMIKMIIIAMNVSFEASTVLIAINSGFETSTITITRLVLRLVLS